MSRLLFSITLDVGELSTLETALSHYQAVCEREIANGVHSPFRADHENIKRILSIRYDKIHTPAGTFSSSQLEQMARTGQLPKELSDV